MFNARVISGDTFEYHPRNNPTETRTGFIMWFTFEGYDSEDKSTLVYSYTIVDGDNGE